jgi:multiple sugar transport system substrate-binding protein
MMIRNFKRLSYLAAIAAASALVLAGCSVADDTTDMDGTGTGDLPTGTGDLPTGTLAFGNWQWLVEGRGDALWEAVTAYSDENPGASFEQVAIPFGEYANTLATALGGGQGPDIFVVLDSQFVVLADAGLLEPLDDFVGDASLNSSNKEMVVGGAQLGVTWEQVPYALLGNKNVLDEAGITEMPTTMDELIAAAEQVQANTSADGFAVRHRIAEFGGWSLDFQNWPLGFGGGWSDGTNLTIDSPANIQAVTEFKRIYDSGVMPVGDDGSTFRNKFKENSLGFIIDNSGAALSFTSGGSITGEDMISAPLPFPQPGAHQKLILAVNANSKNKELATEFIRWFLTEEGQSLIRPPLGASTLATDVPLPADFLAANPWAETYVQIGSSTKSTLIPGFELESVEYFQTIMEAVERVIVQGQDPAAALGEAQSALE